MINQDQIIHLLQKEIYHISNVKVESITENLLSDRLGIDLVYFLYVFSNFKESTDYSGRSAHALKRVQRTGIAVQQSSAAVQPRPLGMG